MLPQFKLISTLTVLSLSLEPVLLVLWLTLLSFQRHKPGRYFSSLRHRRNKTLVKSVCETERKSLLWVPTLEPGFQ